MVDDELEPGPDPGKIRNPLSRRPAPPPRIDQVLRSYNEDRAFSIRRRSEKEALEVKSEITRAVYYLNVWEGYDIRVRPYVTEHMDVSGVTYTFQPGNRKLGRGWYDADGEFWTEDEFSEILAGGPAEHYWKTNFHVHDPLPRGFRQMSKGKLAEAHENSASTRGVAFSTPRTRRTVRDRAK